MNEFISYQCINCQKSVTFHYEKIPKCKNCDGKIFKMTREGKSSMISTSLGVFYKKDKEFKKEI